MKKCIAVFLRALPMALFVCGRSLNRRKSSIVVAGSLLLALITGPAWISAQNVVTGGVTGTVTDPSGAVVATATVTISNAATGENSTFTTSDSGGFLFSFLKPGEYTLNVTQKGFSTATMKVQVQLGQTASAN